MLCSYNRAFIVIKLNPTIQHAQRHFLHLEMFNGIVNSSNSSSNGSSIEMEKYSEIKKGLELAACESTQAHLELWAATQGNSNATCNSLYRGEALCTIHILIFLHFIWNKFHEKKQWIRGVSAWASDADTAAYTDFLSPYLASDCGRLETDCSMGLWPHCIEKMTRNIGHH